MGGCQNYAPFWGALNTRCRNIIGIQKRGHHFDNHPSEPASSQCHTWQLVPRLEANDPRSLAHRRDLQARKATATVRHGDLSQTKLPVDLRLMEQKGSSQSTLSSARGAIP